MAFKGLLSPVIPFLVKLGVTPAAATVSGLFITVTASVFVWKGDYLTGGIILILGSLFDAVDGSIARLTNTSSKAGAALDSIMDRVGEIVVLTAVLAGKAGSEHDSLLYIIPAAMGGSLLVSYVRARAEGLGIECEVGLFTRTERLVLVISGIVFAAFWGTVVLVWSCAVVAAGSWFTALQRLLKVTRDGKGIPLD
jgi:CDP-diacylglycerol--glycerol-3-phosphate 3-phosphatidyltransferase